MVPNIERLSDRPLVIQNSHKVQLEDIKEILVIDVEEMMKQFYLALGKLDEIAKQCLSDRQKRHAKIIKLNQLKKILYDDLYASVSQLNEETPQLPLKEIEINGNPGFQGYITIPAFWRVLDFFFELAPRKAIGKRAFLIEALLDSIGFLEEIQELIGDGRRIKEVFRFALQAMQERDSSRSFRALVTKIIQESGNESNSFLFVDANSQFHVKNTKEYPEVKADFSARPLHRVASSHFRDPLMERIRRYLGIKTVLEEAGIPEGRMRFKSNQKDTEAISKDAIIQILDKSGSIFDKSVRISRNAEKAIEVTLWTAVYTWYK